MKRILPTNPQLKRRHSISLHEKNCLTQGGDLRIGFWNVQDFGSGPTGMWLLPKRSSDYADDVQADAWAWLKENGMSVGTEEEASPAAKKAKTGTPDVTGSDSDETELKTEKEKEKLANLAKAQQANDLKTIKELRTKGVKHNNKVCNERTACVKAIITEYRCKNLEEHINAMDPDVFIILEAQTQVKKSSSTALGGLSGPQILELDDLLLKKLAKNLIVTQETWFNYIWEQDPKSVINIHAPGYDDCQIKAKDAFLEKCSTLSKCWDTHRWDRIEDKITKDLEKTKEDLYEIFDDILWEAETEAEDDFYNKKSLKKTAKQELEFAEITSLNEKATLERLAELEKNWLELWGNMFSGNKQKPHHGTLPINPDTIRDIIKNNKLDNIKNKWSKVRENIHQTWTVKIDRHSTKIEWNEKADKLFEEYRTEKEKINNYYERTNNKKNEYKAKENDFKNAKSHLNTIRKFITARTNTKSCTRPSLDFESSGKSCLPALIDILNKSTENQIKWNQGETKFAGDKGEVILIRTKPDVTLTNLKPIASPEDERSAWTFTIEKADNKYDTICIHAPAPGRIAKRIGVLKKVHKIAEDAKNSCIVMGDFNVNEELHKRNNDIKTWFEKWTIAGEKDWDEDKSSVKRSGEGDDMYCNAYDKIMILKKKQKLYLTRDDNIGWASALAVRRYSDHVPRFVVIGSNCQLKNNASSEDQKDDELESPVHSSSASADEICDSDRTDFQPSDFYGEDDGVPLTYSDGSELSEDMNDGEKSEEKSEDIHQIDS